MAAATYRRPGSEARHVRDLVFERLPSVVRDRLATCLAEGGAPAPLLVDASRRIPASARRWRLLAAAALVAEVVLWFTGFGDTGSPLALQPLAYAAAHGAAIFALLFSLLRAARVARAQGGAPVPDGRYLFALDLVEVEGHRVRLTDLHTLRRVEARPGKRGPSVVLVFADAHEVTFEEQPRAEPLALSVKDAVGAATALVLPDDHPRLERIDPFFELRVSDDWASAGAGANEQRPLFVRAPLPALTAALLVASALAGFGLHALRNRLSDDEMFAQASKIPVGTADDDRWRVGPYTGVRHADAIDALRLERARGNETALKDYLRKPGARQREAEDALFDIRASDPKALADMVRRGGPRAKEAAEALFELQKGDLDALAAYVRRRGPYADRADDQLFELARKSGETKSYRYYLAHGKRHADEVQSVLLPEAAYREVTRKTDDAGLLGDFVREYPDSAHAWEIKAALHGLYVDALRTYAERKPGAAGLRFVTALLAELEDRADPSVTIEVGVDAGAAIPAADVKFGARYGAEYSPVEPHFDASTLSSLASQLRVELAGTILASFANGTVKPIGSGFSGGAGRPSIVIRCEPVVTDTLFALREKLRLSSVRFQVELHAVVPARSQELTWKYTTPGTQNFKLPEKAEGTRDLDRADLIDSSYMGMRMDAATQITNRVQLDL